MKTNLNKNIIRFTIFSLVVLFFLEIFLRYDSWDRQIALAITNLGTLAIYLLIQRFFKRKYQIDLPWFVILALALGVWLDAAGNFAHFYADLAWWDDFVHVIGTMAVAVAIYTALYFLNREGKIKIGRFALPFFTVASSLALSAFYEITEYWGDMLFATYRIGDKFDTASDLQWNLLGALLVVLVGNWLVKNHQQNKKNSDRGV